MYIHTQGQCEVCCCVLQCVAVCCSVLRECICIYIHTHAPTCHCLHASEPYTLDQGTYRDLGHLLCVGYSLGVRAYVWGTYWETGDILGIRAPPMCGVCSVYVCGVKSIRSKSLILNTYGLVYGFSVYVCEV